MVLTFSWPLMYFDLYMLEGLPRVLARVQGPHPHWQVWIWQGSPLPLGWVKTHYWGGSKTIHFVFDGFDLLLMCLTCVDVGRASQSKLTRVVSKGLTSHPLHTFPASGWSPLYRRWGVGQNHPTKWSNTLSGKNKVIKFRTQDFLRGAGMQSLLMLLTAGGLGLVVRSQNSQSKIDCDWAESGILDIASTVHRPHPETESAACKNVWYLHVPTLGRSCCSDPSD
jgi:hypothetical protein